MAGSSLARESMYAMRYVYRRYSDGSFAVIRTENDGSNPQTVEDTRPDENGARRITASIDASFDDNPDGASGVAEGLERVNRVLTRQ